jgi:molybdopterin synthase sulfur carrier subunit
VKVSFYATMRPVVGGKTADIPLREGATVRRLVEAIIQKFPQLGQMFLDDAGELSPRVHVFVNGRGAPYLREQLDTPLAATDRVDVFPPVAGG